MVKRSNNKQVIIVVRALSKSSVRGVVDIGGRVFPCALGRSGARAIKREGDGATPIGRWRLRSVLYRRDRLARPRSLLPIKAIRMSDGWCDAPTDSNYNRAVRLPYAASFERLFRDDHVYDLIVVLSHNERPRKRGAGSAIFMHVARPGFSPTEGCIALRLADLRRVIEVCHGKTSIVI